MILTPFKQRGYILSLRLHASEQRQASSNDTKEPFQTHNILRMTQDGAFHSFIPPHTDSIEIQSNVVLRSLLCQYQQLERCQPVIILQMSCFKCFSGVIPELRLLIRSNSFVRRLYRNGTDLNI